ncbi:MAG: T9SS type A sorting domain-containing protein [Bacteroidota bacterium]
MKKNLLKSFKPGLFVAAALLTIQFCSVSFAATFTAVASGNWSSSATWGGIIPALNNLTDQVTIPAGITVTMDNDLSLNGITAQINVLGTLNANSGNTFTMLTGNLSGSGTIMGDHMVFGTGANLFFTGMLNMNTFRTSSSGMQSSANMMINEELELMAGIMSIQSGGTLSLASGATIHRSGGQLTVSGGTLNLGSNYHVRYSSSSATSGVELSGAGLQNVTIDSGSGNTVNLNTDLDVNGTLTLTSGTLDLDNNHLVINGGVAASGSGNIASSNTSNITVMTNSMMNGSLRFHPSAHSINNLTIAVGSAYHAGISGTLNIQGALNLTSGALNLDNADLHIMGSLSGGGTGTITATSASNSNITINTSGTPAGVLHFTTGSNTVNDFTVNISGGGAIMMGSDMVVEGTLNLTAGHVDMGNNMLTISSSGSISGGNSNSYIKLGASGSLNRQASLLFTTNYPVGTGTAYLPATVGLNLGSSSGMVRVGVRSNVYANGTSGTDMSAAQAMVDATWDLQSDITSNLDMELDLMWSAASEVNGFDRNMSYISHYTNSSWDLNTSSAASTISGGMFSQTRTNITSLSPFAVFDQSTTAETKELADAAVEVYPNPASDKITFSNIDVAQGPVSVDIISIYGQAVASYELTEGNSYIPVNELPKGNYFIQLNSNYIHSVKQFTKN